MTPFYIAGRPATVQAERLRQVRDSLRQAATDAPDFWSVVGQTELALLEAVVAGTLADTVDALIAKFNEHKQRVPAAGLWDSVYNEALFTLEPYLGIAGERDERAAQTLLDALKALAA